MYFRLLQNHVLANLLFALVIVVGSVSYLMMPRQQDPTINFNWIDITTPFPGASASDVESQVTDVLEEAIRNISDIDFVSSNSRKGLSNILVRFQDISDRELDKRVADLRREIQTKNSELPQEVDDPIIIEVTSANAFPTATVVVAGPANDESLRLQAELAKKDLERILGIERVVATGLPQPELQVLFDPVSLMRHRLSPPALSDTVAAYYADVAAGNANIDGENWLVRLTGTDRDPAYLASLPVATARGEVPLDNVATVQRGREAPRQLVRFNGDPAVNLAALKRGDANILAVVERIRSYVERRNDELAGTGINLVLADDQTEVTRNAISVMQTNAMLGLILVLLVAWLFVGSRIGLLTCIGIPFVLAGTFWVLREAGQTLNTSVLLGVVISLGMLVDDAVVVVEAIYYRLQRGMEVLEATREALGEVLAPVTTAVLTTMSAFLPLMLLPGVLGKFMLVIPLVVTVALAISLVEAYWMLPAHVVAAKVNFSSPSAFHRWRVRALHWIRIRYTRLLLKVMRRPVLAFIFILALFAGAVGAMATVVKFDFFASDPKRIFYINVYMPPGTPVQETLDKVLEVEARARRHIKQEETRSIVSYAGQMFTDTTRFVGDHYGQVLVSLEPAKPGLRAVDEVANALRADVTATPGPARVALRRIAGGPPTSKPISVKVRGDNLETLRAAANELKSFMDAHPAITDVADDSPQGQRELVLRYDTAAIRQAGLDPDTISRTLALLVDGEVPATMQDRGEELELRVRARDNDYRSPEELLRFALPDGEGGLVPLDTLVDAERRRGPANIRHFDFRRAITVEADIVEERIDTMGANAALRDHWAQIGRQYTDVELDFQGELDDIQESLDAIYVLALFGVGLIYLILGTQFRSYFQPLMILVTLPMAFTGVVLGLLITGNPMSLYTLYGLVALAGISVNAAIVLIAAANDRLAAGMSLLHATVYAARRRVIPILITSLTTIAGLFSLATGLGGESLLWGPVATSIVWGLGFSATMTLFVVPLLYRLTMPCSKRAPGRE